ncbi:MAG: conditioned medium-induced protein 4 [Haloferacaceae archaeon]
MDDRTEELRDIFVDATGTSEVTERQRDARGSLVGGDDAGVRDVVERMRDRYAFGTDLPLDSLVRVVEGFFDGEDDATLADALGVDPETVFRARMDLHLVADADLDLPVDVERLRTLVVEGADVDDCIAALDADRETVARARRVVAAEMEATRANGRFRDAFAERLTDADLATRLASDARDDGLEEATEDIETDVSF